MHLPTIKYVLLFSVSLWGGVRAFGQKADTVRKAVSDTSLPPNIPRPVYGPYDTIVVPAKIYGDELLPATSGEYVWVRAPMTPAMRRRYEEWTRLRNAVYVTYPYARRAGLILNEMNAKLALLNTEGQRKAYIDSREKELKKQFTEPLEQLSIYQGKVLMKLINRQTGNNCYNIIKEYKGGFTARFWQTVAFLFSSSLKQPYDPKGDDKPIEVIVEEVERMYRG
ncbi:MAG TPA: DUF4294 domain-containing protein [Puia sp.]|jgi:hypothetical protein|nr:DUF4294 domain-containing protein [Puia sp.]